MPSTIEWTGASLDGAYDTAGNWVGSVAPVAGDTAFFGAKSVYPMTTGPGSGIALAAINILSSCKTNFGSSGTAISSNLTATTFKYAGSGQYAYFAGSMTTLQVDGTGTGQLIFTGGTPTTIILQGGFVTLGAAMVLGSATVEVTGGIHAAEKNGSARVGTLNISAGSFTTRKHIDVVAMSGDVTGPRACTVSFVDDANCNSGTKTITQWGGTLKWYSSGTLGVITGRRGIIDTSGNPFNTFTIAAGTRYTQNHFLQKTWGAGTVADSSTEVGSASGGMGPFTGLGTGGSFA